MVHVLPDLVARITSPSTRPVTVPGSDILISSIPKSFPEPPELALVLPFTIAKTAEAISTVPEYQLTEYFTQLQVVEVIAAKSAPTLTPLTVKYSCGKLLGFMAVAQNDK